MTSSGDGKDASRGAAKAPEYVHEYEVYTNGPVYRC